MIRREVIADIEAIRQINLAAFETPAEAGLVDTLRRDTDPFISLVAELGGEVLGHILFTPMKQSGSPKAIRIAGLAPMAVLPSHQNRGIGSKLVEAGLQACRAEGFEAVAVLGHHEFYPRFGFLPSTRFSLKSEYDVPEEVFMALELEPRALEGLRGILRYHEAFGLL
jgi:putative acetyltransferase